MLVKVAVCQVPGIRENIAAWLRWIEKFAGQAEAAAASLICFSECFLSRNIKEPELPN
jgi:predicted amidohydrolase